jgi:selenocysteine-specific elongation factor
MSEGAMRPARIVLDAPIVARAGDRFVLRAASPVSTVGGGVITDPAPVGSRVRLWSRPELPSADRLRLLISEAAGAGLSLNTLPIRLGITKSRIEATLNHNSQHVVVVGDRLFDMMWIEKAAERVLQDVHNFHIREPIEPGLSLQSIRSGLAVVPVVADAVLAQLVAHGSVVVDKGVVYKSGWSPQPSAAQQSALAAVERVLHESGREPPSVSELAATYGPEVGSVLRFLERRGQIVQVEPDRYYAASALEAVVRDLRSGTETGRAYGPSELRDVLGVSRKYLIPLLEYCDRTSITVRQPAGRIVQHV